MQSLTDLSLNELIPALERGEFSARELTQAYLDRIDQIEPALQAFITLTPEVAFQQADTADRKRIKARNGTTSSHSPLLGVPIAIKDV